MSVVDALGLPGVLIGLGAIGIVVGIVLQVGVGDTLDGGDSGVTLLYYLACIAMFGLGICLGAT